MKQILLTFLIATCCAKASAQVISTFAGTGVSGYTGDGGMATAAEMHFPWGLAVDNAGNLYIDTYGGSVIRKVSPSGIITTIAGNGTSGFSGDGGPATDAKLNTPNDVTVDRIGNIYIADQYNYRIRKVDLMGIITTIAGNGIAANTGDNGPATAASIVTGAIVVDSVGNIFVGTDSSVRKIDTFGIITKIAGSGPWGYSGDGGPATAAQLGARGIDIDKYGNIFLADVYNYRIRKIDTAGIVTTVAGNGINGFFGDGGPATLAKISQTTGVKVDEYENIYISDYSANNRIRKVDAFGIITTFAGNGLNGYWGDGGPATAAALNFVGHVARYGHGNIYIADRNNNVVRMVSVNPYFLNGHLQHATFCSGIIMSIDTLLAANDSNSGVTETWSLIGGPYHGFVSAAYVATTTGGTVYPSGLVYTSVSAYTGADTFTVRITDGIISDTTTVYVNVTPTPVIGAISGTDSVCIGDSILLSDTTTGGAWSASNTHASITAGMVHGLSAGTDTISYTVIDFCGATTVTHIVTVNNCPSSVPALMSAPPGLLICPNPAGGAFSVRLSSPVDEPVTFTIIGMMGETAKEFCGNTNTTATITPGLPAGIYLLRAVTRHGVCTQRVTLTAEK